MRLRGGASTSRHPAGAGWPSPALLYLLLALPVVLFQVFGTPPFQMPDEPRHFMRAVQIAGGGLLGHRYDDTFSGGDLEIAAQDVAVAFRPLALDTEKRLDLAVVAHIATLRWGMTGKTPALFENTSIYPPTLYAPASLAIRLGKALDLTILSTYYLARLAMGLSGLLLATLAIRTCAIGRNALFVFLSFPFVLSAFGSISQDGLAISAGALAVALCSRYLAEDRAMPVAIRAGVALLLGAVVGARLPLAPLLALLVIPTSSSRPGLRPADLAASALCLVPVSLSLLCAAVAKIPFRAQDGVAPADQVAFVLRHPAGVVQTLWTTMAEHGGEFAREMVSVLGWWSGMGPSFFYWWIAGCLAAALTIDMCMPAPARSDRSRLLALGAAIVATLGVFATFYVAWTPVGGAQIEGVQGRYFVVPALASLLALPRFSPAAAYVATLWPSQVLLVLGRAICLGVGCLDLWAVPTTILARYYQ
ncbi:DUF2142 domain-containing protein [Lichenibacterium dinghuense]|uniref:DUF2142 domain-containing protein n=1 Tax=Lichenibacterium dinghuense TaxID=2895977 RepID=UPI001F3E1853|nr:DUF2142 domain-containing protein [Lichenibacterium sp. 6Y81]